MCIYMYIHIPIYIHIEIYRYVCVCIGGGVCTCICIRASVSMYMCVQKLCIWCANMFMNTPIYVYIGASAKGMAGRPDA